MNNNISIDDELRLLKGSSFFIDQIEIKPFTIGEIVEIGYEKYQQLMNIFALEVEDILKEIPEELNGITVFELYLQSGLQELFEGFISAISLFLRIENPNNLSINNTFNVVINNKNIINKDNWSDICKIIQMQNCVKKIEKEEYNPANERAKKFIEKLNKMKQELPKIKSDITLSSMISGVAWKAQNININNIWDLTIYQLYDALNRLNLIDDYQFTFTGIYTGTVDGKKIDMKKINWMKIINT